MSLLAQDILETLFFFDIVKQPLTILELFRAKHGTDVSLNELHECIATLKKEGRVFTDHGLVGCAGSERWIQRRVEHDSARDYAWKRVKKILFLIQMNPFIKATAVCNSIAFNNITDTSDIDFFIVAKKNRAWLARLLIAIPAKIFRLRPGECDRAPICLSFFVDEEHLDLRALAIKRDIYFAHWIDALLWIYDSSHVRDVVVKKNQWTRDLLKRDARVAYHPFGNSSGFIRLIRFFLRLLDYRWCERMVCRMQKKWLPLSLTQSRPYASSVILNEHTLKMHVDDKREVIARAYEQHLRA